MYGLIGYPLSHSFSKSFFAKKFEDENIKGAEYHNFPIKSITEFPELIRTNPRLRGLNVTIPYKEKVIPYLDHIDPDAAEIGAVNTVKFTQEGNLRVLSGFNTDVYGFTRSLNEILKPGMNLSKALILGTGGASKAVAWALEKMNVSCKFVSTRESSALGYSDLDEEIITGCQIIINTTPLGTFPDISSCPAIPYEYITANHILFDLVYNPSLTLFLQKGLEQNAVISNGLKMLEYQAIKSWEIWNS